MDLLTGPTVLCAANWEWEESSDSMLDLNGCGGCNGDGSRWIAKGQCGQMET